MQSSNDLLKESGLISVFRPSKREALASRPRFLNVLFGAPLSSQDVEHTLLSKLLALPVFASDAISSSAYATQEILFVLGAAGLWGAIHEREYGMSTLGVTGCIILLLAVVVTSYWQTIFAYPNGGGSYIVSKRNLGTNAGLIAAAALLIDYVLTVAVSIAAGIQNLASIPFLERWFHPEHHLVLLSVAAIVLLTLANLRGVKESGKMFAVPTYAFIFMVLLMIAVGGVAPALGWRLDLGEIREVQANFPVSSGPVHGAVLLTWAVLLKAFASGCAALTGTEAVSNGIPAFQEPRSRNAATTLVWMGVILGALFLGISLLAANFHLVYYDGAPAVIDQLSGAVFGKTGPFSILYVMTQLCTALILVLAANTSFADFPRLSSVLARDSFMPKQMSALGDKLVFSNGILILGVAAAALLIMKGGVVEALIPLYATGVFTAFTLSQAGMVQHWRRSNEPGWRKKALINGIGAVSTAVVLCTIIIEKFADGAWLIVVLIGVLFVAFKRIQEHYAVIGFQLRTRDYSVVRKPVQNTVLVLISGVHYGVISALRYARTLSNDVRAVCIETEEGGALVTTAQWAEQQMDLPLVVIPSPYRSLIGPLLRYIKAVLREEGEPFVTVLIPEFVPTKWWHSFLHGQTGLRLKFALLGAGDRVVVANVRYHLQSELRPSNGQPSSGKI